MQSIVTKRPLRKAQSLAAASLLALFLAGCGGSDSGGGGTSPGVVPTPTPSPTVTPSPPPSPSASPPPSPTPSPTSFTAAVSAMYDTPPNILGCQTGTLKTSVRTEFLNRLNALRGLHGLPAVTYTTSAVDDQEVDQSSLMQAANGTLSHDPPNNWLCFTNTGHDGAASSNLIGGWGNGLPYYSEDDYLGLWLTEGGSAATGHRRWILNPFLGKVAYGRVMQQYNNGGTPNYRADGATMKVFNFAIDPPTPAAASIPDFVAYPFNDYPVRYFRTSDYLSFSVVASKASRDGNANVKYDSATITVSNGSTNLTVTDVTRDNQGFGLPNHIQWRVTGLQQNVTYTVRITGITGAPQTSYQYNFTVQP